MQIKINEKHRIVADDTNYILEQVSTSKKTGRVYYTSKGFYGTLESALSAWAGLNIKQSDVTSINEIKALIKEQNKLIRGLLDE